MRLNVTAHENNFGASLTGIQLSDLNQEEVQSVREAWLQYQVIYFPQQPLSHEGLQQFTSHFGSFGVEPYVKAIDGYQNILEVRRNPEEQIAPFGASWHSDWSFQASPPSATILHAKVVPPVGGDTLYADGIRAYETLDPSLRNEIEDMWSIHSARRPYSHEGFETTGGRRRSMTILPSDSAWETQDHPIVRTHPESGRKALWVNPVYTIGIRDMADDEAEIVLQKLFSHCLTDQFVYKHKWQKDMLIMWDNRSVQHCAQGGYDGHLRVMHRTTVAGDPPH
ncbi:MAG: TauD/TfdA family dioxygenase [Gammaproteobacteria bacterium]|nr:TauD/TfdA family dioxygenase [Gammaproteobacteria bacterium]